MVHDLRYRLKYVVLLTIFSMGMVSLKGQTKMKSHAFIGYDFFSEQYYTPTNNINERYTGSDFDSRYIFIQGYSPYLGIGINYSFNSTQALIVDASFSILLTTYDIEDRSVAFYYPFGRIDLENYAVQLTPCYEHQFNNKFRSATYWSISAGPFFRYHIFREHVIQDDIDALLRSFPLSRNTMNAFILGIRGQLNFGVRYSGRSLESQFIYFSIYADLNTQGMLPEQTNVFSWGLKMGIDLF